MKNNKIIIYDDSCPLCSAYTKAFISTGMIEKEDRRNFTTIEPGIIDLLDKKRCANEIPVIDKTTHEVWYGIDAIAEILQTKIPSTKRIVYFKPFNWLLRRFYKLISYNRRVIVAAEFKPGNFDCTPDFNYKYRIAFMFLFLAFNTAMLLPIREYVINNSSLLVSYQQLQGVHCILVLINISLACTLKTKKAIEFLGQVNMLALTTVLSFVPIILLNRYHLIEQNLFNNVYLLLIALLVCKEYKRRMMYAGILKKHPFIVTINIVSLTGLIIYLVY